MSIRPIKMQSQATPTMEGAGVHLHRVLASAIPIRSIRS